MFDAHKNFAASLVVTPPSPDTSGTSLTVTTGDGALFPAVPFNCTVAPAGMAPTLANAEIVRVTNITGDVFTITRAQEGTNAMPIAAGYVIANTITVKALTDIEAAVGGGSFPIFSDVQTVYVNNGGDDGTADGTPFLPFLTIQAALDSISDASATKPYLVVVGPGEFTGNLSVPGFVSIQGAGGSPKPATYDTSKTLTVITGNIAFAAGFATLADVSFGENTSLTGGADGNSITAVQRCGAIFNTYVGFSANGGIINVMDSLALVIYTSGGIINISGGGGEIHTSAGTSAVTVKVANFVGTAGLDVSGYNMVTATVLQSSFPSVVVTEAGNGATLNIGTDCFPGGGLSIGGGTPTVNYINAAYAPTTPGDWPGTPPNNVGTALDTLVASGGGSVPVQTQIVYVSKGGDDGTATGSLALPFLTVKAAVDSIVDSSPTKAYVVTIGPGEYDEDDFTLPVNVNLTGTVSGFNADSADYITLLKSSGVGSLVITVATAASTITSISNISFGEVELSSAAGTSISQFFTINECSANNLTLNQGMPFVLINGGSLYSLITKARKVECYYVSGTFVMINDAGTSPNAYLGLFHCSGNATLDGTTGQTAFVEARGCWLNDLSVSGDGVTLDLDKGVTDNGIITITGGTPTITFTNTLYAPATPGDWAGTPPTTLEEAIDRIASVVGGVVPIP